MLEFGTRALFEIAYVAVSLVNSRLNGDLRTSAGSIATASESYVSRAECALGDASSSFASTG